MAVQSWVGLYKKDESIDVDCKSCLSTGIQTEIAKALRATGTLSTELDITISRFLVEHPLLSLIHQRSVQHAKEILCVWYSNPHPAYANPPNEDDDETTWDDYFQSSKSVCIIELDNKEGIPSKRYKLLFRREKNAGNASYYVIGPRDTMLALFGWHSKISDEGLDIDMKFKIELDRVSFLRFHVVIDEAERRYDTPRQR